MDKTQKEKIREHLEANFLDGDKINDCGGVTFSVDGALDIAEYFYDLAIKETEERLVKNITDKKELLCRMFRGEPAEGGLTNEEVWQVTEEEIINLIRNK